MGFFFILPLFIFLCFKKLIYEFFFCLSLIFLLFLSSGWHLEMSFFSFSLLSWSLLFLSAVIVSFMILSNLSFSLNFNDGVKFMISVFMMFVMLFFVFICSNFFMFYMFFEFSILPIFFILCGWGFNFERLQAGLYMFIYTVFFSLPFLVFLCSLNVDQKSTFFLLFKFNYSSSFNLLFVFLTIFMFLVKMPSFLLHLWLPKAHVEAPVSGSMILAGLLLKLGAYGLIIYLNFVFFFSLKFSEFFMSLGLWGGLISSIICFRQIDLKKMVAFMSVSHMGLVISGIFANSFLSFWGVMMMLLAHGMSSSGLFFSLNCFYERFFSRSLILVKGNNMMLVCLSLWFFLLISCNISAPPSLNFFSELSLLLGISFSLKYSIFLFLAIMFLGTVCSFHLFVSIFHGLKLHSYSFDSVNLKEHMILLVHMIFLFIIFIFI